MDLAYHFLFGAGIALLVILLSGQRIISDKVVVTGFFLSLLAGCFKELVIDLWIRGVGMEVADVTLTWTGGAVMVLGWKFIELFAKNRNR